MTAPPYRTREMSNACWFRDPLACPSCRELCGIDPVPRERAEHLAMWNVVGQSPEGCLQVEPKGGWDALRSDRINRSAR